MNIKKLRLIISLIFFLLFFFLVFAPARSAEIVLDCKPIVLKGRALAIWPEKKSIKVSWERHSSNGEKEIMELEFLSSEVLVYNLYKHKQSLTEIRLLNWICNPSWAHLLLGPPELFDP